MDRISKLPIGIIEAILCLLPIQDAARTSILSRDWRYHWINIPKLAFNEKTFEVSTKQTESSVLEQTGDKPSKRRKKDKRRKLIYAISQALLMHQGPMHEFNLTMVADSSCVEIDHILLHLSKKNTLKILNLHFAFGDPQGYVLPASLFSLHQLTELHLHACALLHGPPSFDFGCLTTLSLEIVWIYEKTLRRLLSGCPLLKRLTLDSDGMTLFDNIFGNGQSTIADLFECLPLIEHLTVSSNVVECFAPERLPKKLPTTLNHLKFLCIDGVCFSHRYEFPFLALLLRSSPNLEKLKLDVSPGYYLEDEEDIASFTLEDYSDLMFEHLNELEVLYFSYSENELDFVELVMAKSPVLKKVFISLCRFFDKYEDSELINILSWTPCESPVVKFTVCKFQSDLPSSYLKVDRITKLPEGIIETILGYLPIQEAARTSILSKEWRYRWTKIPKLAFLEDTCETSTNGVELSVLEQTYDKPSKRKEMEKGFKFLYTIHQVLRMHQGPIHEFALCMKLNGSSVMIDRMILYLSIKYTIKKLVLCFIDRDCEYMLPISFFSFHQLTELLLFNCSLLDEPSVYEFGCLTTLCLRCISTDDQFLVRLLSRCPLLTSLTLDTDIIYTGKRSIVDLFKCLPLIEYLSLWFHIVLSFIPERLPEVLPTTLIHLKCLRMEFFCFSHKYGLPSLVLLIRSSPNLEKLELVIRDLDWPDEEKMGSFTLERYSDIMLERLKALEIINFSDAENESDFVKHILAKSPVLKEVRISPHRCIDEDKASEISKTLLCSPRASHVAKIIVGKFQSNQSCI